MTSTDVDRPSSVQLTNAIATAKNKISAGRKHQSAMKKEAAYPASALQLVSKALELEPDNSFYIAEYARVRKEVERWD